MPVYLKQITTGHIYVFNPALAERADMQPFECPAGSKPRACVAPVRVDKGEETQPASADDEALPIFATTGERKESREEQADASEALEVPGPPEQPTLEPPRTSRAAKK
ncbi:MAG TPA: hypothetical protein PK250_12765 [Syntrophobacter fumaroxidans]|nr:hypothetical protein [Syntrophobacter fumaroxidans]